MKSIVIVALGIILLFSGNLFAQGGDSRGMGARQAGMANFRGKVRGRLVDSQSGLPVEYANIIIYKTRDSSLVTGGITDVKGEFEVPKIPAGSYFIEFKFIGYNTNRMDKVMINPRQPDVNLGDVKLTSFSELLDAVVVTAEKSMIQHNLDKKVFNVGKDISVEGGTALEVMQNIPLVDVDMEGNVSLRGSQNVNILIDGRPSTYSSIEEIPANIIESVEVITNPSARYDPDGLSGLINIVLQKKRDPGYHGMVMLNVGTGDKYNGSLNFNVGQNRFNYFTNISLRQQKMNGSTLTNNVFSSSSNTIFSNQDQDFTRRNRFLSLRGGIDYFVNASNTITLSGGYNSRVFNGWDLTQNENSSLLAPNPISFSRESEGINSFNSFNVSLNYKRISRTPGQEITADVFINSNGGSFENQMAQHWLGVAFDPLHERQYSDITGTTYTAQTDMVQPVGYGGRLEAGLKIVQRMQDNDLIFSYFNGGWSPDHNRSNHFIYNEQLYSAYAIYSNTYGALSYQGGLRAELAQTQMEQRVNNERIPRYFQNLFPSAHLKWDANASNFFQLAFSRRVSRPNSRFLNPFINYSDPLNLSQGNPYLNPEFTNSFELGYYLNLPTTKVTTTAFYRSTTDIISRYVEKIKEGSDTLMHTFRNISDSYTMGLEGVITQNLKSWWRLNGSVGFFNTELNAPDLLPEARKGSNWTAKATSTWNIGSNWEIQLNGNYRSPMVSAGGTGTRFWESGGGQGKTDKLFWFDLGVRLQVLNKKGTITLRVSDLLNTMKYRAYTYGDGFTSDITRMRESRVVFVGFSYRINEYRQRRDRSAEDEGSFMDMD